MASCDCMLISKHKRTCGKVTTHTCKTCGDRLCAHCAKNHHAHTNVQKDAPKGGDPIVKGIVRKMYGD